MDDAWVLDFYAERAGMADGELVGEVLGCEQMWGQDLRAVAGLEEAVAAALATHPHRRREGRVRIRPVARAK